MPIKINASGMFPHTPVMIEVGRSCGEAVMMSNHTSTSSKTPVAKAAMLEQVGTQKPQNGCGGKEYHESYVEPDPCSAPVIRLVVGGQHQF